MIYDFLPEILVDVKDPSTPSVQNLGHRHKNKKTLHKTSLRLKSKIELRNEGVFSVNDNYCFNRK